MQTLHVLAEHQQQRFLESPHRLTIELPTSSLDSSKVTSQRAIGSQLVVMFARCGDRYQHVIGMGAGALDTIRPILLSVEGTADIAWPPSPPIQQLDQCELGSGAIGFVGLGMAGTSHWSLSVEPTPVGVCFDVACRLQQRADRLGSSYWPQTDTSDSQCRIRRELGRSLEPDTPGGRLGVEATADLARTPQTVRWRYTVEWIPPEEP